MNQHQQIKRRFYRLARQVALARLSGHGSHRLLMTSPSRVPRKCSYSYADQKRLRRLRRLRLKILGPSIGDCTWKRLNSFPRPHVPSQGHTEKRR